MESITEEEINTPTIKFKDTHREKVPPNKTPALTKSTDMDIWFVSTSNQLFI